MEMNTNTNYPQNPKEHIAQENMTILLVQEPVLLQACYPWRRYFARSLDLLLYSLLWSMFLAFVFHVNLSNRGGLGILLDTVVVLLLLIFLEPLLLSRFGTTPGKVIFGLRLQKPNGERLSYGEGLQRTWGVLGCGMGFCIPVYNLVRLWKSYDLCTRQQEQPWDAHLRYCIKDTKVYRGFVFLGTHLFCFVLLITIIASQQLPPNRGDLTLSEFVENYRYYADYYELDFGNWYLDEGGTWATKEPKGNMIYFNWINDTPPVYQYNLENGYVTGVSFQVEKQNEESYLPMYDEQMILLSLAMVGAQKEMGLFSPIPNRIIQGVNYVNGFNLTEAKVNLTCLTKHTGYLNVGMGILIPDETAAGRHFQIQFALEKLS